jgi:hypothetical protein
MVESNRKLFVGAKVTIDEQSQYWNENDMHNPRGIVGVVTETIFDNDFGSKNTWFTVSWGNGKLNGYQHGDLKVIGTVVGENYE